MKNMLSKKITVAILAALTASISLHAQEVKILHREVQIHGVASQGLFYSNNNNYLTMDTSDGNAQFTEYAVNASMQVSEKFRIGAQTYTHKVGNLGGWAPTLDWAVADYRLKSWLGFRGGKVKTTLGLFNDTQDMEFLHPWVLLPQAAYPVDLRGENIAHEGGDLYGKIGAKKLGKFAYTVYGGRQPGDMEGGYVYAIDNASTHINSYGGTSFGADLRWTTPVKGLLFGSSFIAKDLTTLGTAYATTANINYSGPYSKTTLADHTTDLYTEYTFGNFTFDGEYFRQQRQTYTTTIHSNGTPTIPAYTATDSRYGYVSADYRFTKWLQVGAYNSRFIADWNTNLDTLTNHVYDQALTARFDLNKNVDLKIEGHFMDGNGGTKVDRGFYPMDNGGGKNGNYNPSTNMLAIRAGYHF
jgi:hypothetical protein